MRSNSAKDRCGAIAKLGDACLGVASARSYVASWAIRIIETGSCEIKAPCTCQTCHCQTCLSSQDYYALRPVGGQQKPPAPVNPAAAMTHFIPIHRRLRPTREQTKVPSPVNISTAKPKFLPPLPPVHAMLLWGDCVLFVLILLASALNGRGRGGLPCIRPGGFFFAHTGAPSKLLVPVP